MTNMTNRHYDELLAAAAEADEDEKYREAFEAMREALRDTLQAPEAHLDADALHAKLKHRDALCPCNSTEVVKARAALALADKVRR